MKLCVSSNYQNIKFNFSPLPTEVFVGKSTKDWNMISFLHPKLLLLLTYVLFCFVLFNFSRVKAGGEKKKRSREGEQESY